MSKKPLTKRLEQAATRQVATRQADIIEKLHQANDSYWSVKDIAKYVGKSESTVRRKLLTDPRWLKPFQFGENAYKRWLASEVKKACCFGRIEGGNCPTACWTIELFSLSKLVRCFYTLCHYLPMPALC